MLSNVYPPPQTANFRRMVTGCRPILVGSSTTFHDVTVGRHRCCWRVKGHHLLHSAGRCVSFRQPSGFTGGARSERHQTQAPAGDEGKEYNGCLLLSLGNAGHNLPYTPPRKASRVSVPYDKKLRTVVSCTNVLCDHAPAQQREFRQYLRVKYR